MLNFSVPTQNRSVSLIRSPIVSQMRSVNNEATPSIAFAYIGGYLRDKGYIIDIIDAIAEGLDNYWALKNFPGYQCQGITFDEIIRRIPRDTQAIAFSAMFSGEWPVVRELIKQIRSHFPNALFIAGGEHITALTEYSLRDCPAIDICVRGEGEHTLFEVLEAANCGVDADTIAGIGFLDASGDYIETGTLPRIREINDIPWPYWPEGYLEKFWDAGKSYGVQSERDMPMMLSRGCPFQCTFCSSPNMWTTRYILRDVDDIIAETKSYIQRYGVTAIQLYDLTAITKKRWAVEFLSRVIAENFDLKWSLPSGTRSEALDDETLGLLSRAGCNYLVYAPESGSPKTLEKIKKRIKLKQITQSILTAKSHNLVVRTNLIIGFPDETRSDVMQTIRYGLSLAWRGADEVSINIFSPYPGTEIFAALKQSGRVVLSDQYFLSLTSLNSDYTATNPLTVNDFMGSRELAFYRLAFMILNYGLGYIRYPSRILRTLRNIFSGAAAATVFEHRLKDMFQRTVKKYNST